MSAIFGADAIADPNSFAHTLANMDLVAYLIYASIILMPVIILSDKSLTKDERERIIVVFILAFSWCFSGHVLNKPVHHSHFCRSTGISCCQYQYQQVCDSWFLLFSLII